MKITGPGQIQSSSIKKTSRKTTSKGAEFTDALSGDTKTDAAAGTGGAAPLTPLDALLSLQEVPDSTSGRSKGLARANDMLDLLEEVRRGILLGAISGPKLKTLAELARNHRQNSDLSLKGDEKLNELLNEIELRSEVELAKLGF